MAALSDHKAPHQTESDFAVCYNGIILSIIVFMTARKININLEV